MKVNCKICASSSYLIGQKKVLGDYTASYYQCASCGFVQTDTATWLNRAYSVAINKSDVGVFRRNKFLIPVTTAIIKFFYDSNGKFLDYGAGAGIFVRMMRDAGYDFYYFDKYCYNIFAQGFEVHTVSRKAYDIITAFEVFEHFLNPLLEIEMMLNMSDNILFSTELVISPAPPLDVWNYYGLEHGQHISFYSRNSLKYVAHKFGLNFYTNNKSFHLFTKKKILKPAFSLLSHPFFALMCRPITLKKSFIETDYKSLTGRDLNES